MSLKQINTRAKAIRRQKPGMSWHSAQKAAAAALRSGNRPKAKRKSAAVARTHHTKKRRHTVGSTAAAAPVKRRKTKKRGWFGATSSTTGRAVQIIRMGGGMAVGAAGTHVVLRPLEHKVVQMFEDPKISHYVAKAMPWAEMFLGGVGWMMFKNRDLQNVALGVMGSGVHAAAKELPFHMHSPSETVNGISGSDMLQVRIPVNGTLRQRIGSLIQQDYGYTKTPTVGVLNNQRGPVYTPTVGGYSDNYLTSTPTVGDYDTSMDDLLFHSNPFNR